MRIISKFKDYYDTAQCHGFCDSEAIFVRKSEEFGLPTYKSEWGFDVRYPFYHETFGKPFEFAYVGFCGKVYVLLAVPKPQKEQDKILCKDEHRRSQRFNFHSNFSIDDILSGAFPGLEKEKGHRPRKWGSNMSKKAFRVGMERCKEYEYLFDEHNVPYFSLMGGTAKINLVTNPVLNDFGFARLFPPFQAYQEIEMYFGSKLVSEQQPSQITDDKVLRDAKGFDKYSFKHRPK